jgi:hypothetical protein
VTTSSTEPSAKWWEGAGYWYGNFEQAGEIIRHTTLITFKLPNSATGPLEWSDWLYRHHTNEKGEQVTEKNTTAEVLMCYMDELHNETR